MRIEGHLKGAVMGSLALFSEPPVCLASARPLSGGVSAARLQQLAPILWTLIQQLSALLPVYSTRRGTPEATKHTKGGTTPGCSHAPR